jgi:hypothetical protein
MPLAQRALAIYEKALGPDHPTVATSLNELVHRLPETDIWVRPVMPETLICTRPFDMIRIKETLY